MKISKLKIMKAQQPDDWLLYHSVPAPDSLFWIKTCFITKCSNSHMSTVLLRLINVMVINSFSLFVCLIVWLFSPGRQAVGVSQSEQYTEPQQTETLQNHQSVSRDSVCGRNRFYSICSVHPFYMMVVLMWCSMLQTRVPLTTLLLWADK